MFILFYGIKIKKKFYVDLYTSLFKSTHCPWIIPFCTYFPRFHLFYFQVIAQRSVYIFMQIFVFSVQRLSRFVVYLLNFTHCASGMYVWNTFNNFAQRTIRVIQSFISNQIEFLHKKIQFAKCYKLTAVKPNLNLHLFMTCHTYVTTCVIFDIWQHHLILKTYTS